jgi:hypothetical protein
MNNNKFYKLTNNYKEFLTFVEKNLNIEIDETTKLKKIINIYEILENEIIKYGLEINDINHLLTNYDKDNSEITKLKKLVYYKNFLILKKVIRSNEWKTFIINLTDYIFLKIEKKYSIKKVENIFIELLKQYLGFWNGFWKFFNFNKKYIIKKISIIDPDDFNYIFTNIQK